MNSEQTYSMRKVERRDGDAWVVIEFPELEQDACYRTLCLLRPDVARPPRDESVVHNALADAVAQADHAELILARVRERDL